MPPSVLSPLQQQSLLSCAFFPFESSRQFYSYSPPTVVARRLNSPPWPPFWSPHSIQTNISHSRPQSSLLLSTLSLVEIRPSGPGLSLVASTTTKSGLSGRRKSLLSVAIIRETKSEVSQFVNWIVVLKLQWSGDVLATSATS